MIAIKNVENSYFFEYIKNIRSITNKLLILILFISFFYFIFFYYRPIQISNEMNRYKGYKTDLELILPQFINLSSYYYQLKNDNDLRNYNSFVTNLLKFDQRIIPTLKTTYKGTNKYSFVDSLYNIIKLCDEINYSFEKSDNVVSDTSVDLEILSKLEKILLMFQNLYLVPDDEILVQELSILDRKDAKDLYSDNGFILSNSLTQSFLPLKDIFQRYTPINKDLIQASPDNGIEGYKTIANNTFPPFQVRHISDLYRLKDFLENLIIDDYKDIYSKKIFVPLFSVPVESFLSDTILPILVVLIIAVIFFNTKNEIIFKNQKNNTNPSTTIEFLKFRSTIDLICLDIDKIINNKSFIRVVELTILRTSRYFMIAYWCIILLLICLTSLYIIDKNGGKDSIILFCLPIITIETFVVILLEIVNIKNNKTSYSHEEK
ncbi:MAG: hypothetical protein EHM58_02490 [Ignavibacteriae bacterium]|nr:MAG: hypothetical protein EHM58_02490 [Ignavibacteriota bacterium]